MARGIDRDQDARDDRKEARPLGVSRLRPEQKKKTKYAIGITRESKHRIAVVGPVLLGVFS